MRRTCAANADARRHQGGAAPRGGPRRVAAMLVILVLTIIVAIPGRAVAQSADSALARLQSLVEAGDRAGARAIADSLLLALPADTAPYAEALYWRGFTAAQAADAERDYLRLSIAFPLSPRAPDALLALGQLEMARGDRTAARRRFDRLLREYPTGRHVAHASYWSATLAMQMGDRAAACDAFARAQRAVSPENVELANQIEYQVTQCAAIPVDTAPTPTSAASGDRGGGERGRGAALTREYSIQVAAYSTRGDATVLANRLRQQGFEVRVLGARAPYRVRIGRYPTRAAATEALARVRRSHPNSIVVEAEPR